MAGNVVRRRGPLPRPFVALGQPAGVGGGVVVLNRGLFAGRTYRNLFSAELCPSAGSGPYLGLCASSLDPLLAQVALPTGTLPFHFAATGPVMVAGPYALPPGLTLDAVCFDLTGNVLGCVSPVFRYAVQ